MGDRGGGGGAAAGTVAGTVADNADGDTGSVKKQNFHTGPPLTHCGGRLNPVSRTNNSAKPTEFNAADGDTVDKERCAQSSSLDTGSSPVWSVVVGTDAIDNDHATVVATVGDGIGDGAVDTVITVTNPDDETIVTAAKKYHRHSRESGNPEQTTRRNRPNLTPPLPTP